MTVPQIQIEVAYATPERQQIIPLRVPVGTQVREAIAQSQIMRYFPEIDLDKQKVGIWSKTVKLEQELREGDRVEIYRPLIADPKAIRRRRAEQAIDEGRADPVTGGRRRRATEQTDDESE